MLFGVALLAAWSGPAAAACELRARGGAIKRIVQIQLDNVHLRRDVANVPSDLELMPHLRDFLISDGTLGGNHQTSPLAQQVPDALTILTGLYGDRTGVPIGDSYGSFRSDGRVGFATAFAYWTATGGDGKPLMLADTGRTVSAPWVPFTRAGCDVGAVATTGLALMDLAPDVTNVFGAADNPTNASADLLGIAIHCARGSALCAGGRARPDRLPDEPGGYDGFNVLFGDRDVRPVISPGGPVKDINGQIIAGLANPFAPTAAQSLGYAAAMLEAGVPVVYVSIGDAHTQGAQRSLGPGERAHVERLAADDKAFKTFIDRLAAGGISQRNTLFIVVPTGNDRFVGGSPSPPDCNGVTLPCTYPQTGEIDTAINRLLATQRRNVSAFDIAFGSAPPFYLQGNPQATDPLMRTLQQDVGKLTVLNPITNKTDRLAAMLADRAQLRLLHMITASPARAPSFLMFGDPQYFHQTSPSSADCAQPPACAAINPSFVWTSGDIQRIAGDSWFGIVGPGVTHLGQTTDIRSHHADLRPTMLALLGLSDSYAHDGAVLVDALDTTALPPELASGRDTFAALARATKDLDDPLGRLGRYSLAWSTQAIRGGDIGYRRYLDAIGAITARRDALAGEMKAQLDGAAFARRRINPADAGSLVARAETLINEVEDLAGGNIAPAARPWKAASGQQ